MKSPKILHHLKHRFISRKHFGDVCYVLNSDCLHSDRARKTIKNDGQKLLVYL